MISALKFLYNIDISKHEIAIIEFYPKSNGKFWNNSEQWTHAEFVAPSDNNSSSARWSRHPTFAIYNFFFLFEFQCSFFTQF